MEASCPWRRFGSSVCSESHFDRDPSRALVWVLTAQVRAGLYAHHFCRSHNAKPPHSIPSLLNAVDAAIGLHIATAQRAAILDRDDKRNNETVQACGDELAGSVLWTRYGVKLFYTSRRRWSDIGGWVRGGEARTKRRTEGPDKHHANVELRLPSRILHANLASHAHGEAGCEVAQAHSEARAQVRIAGEERVSRLAILRHGDVGRDDDRNDEAENALKRGTGACGQRRGNFK